MIEQDGTIVVHAMDKNVRSEKITLDESPDSLGRLATVCCTNDTQHGVS